MAGQTTIILQSCLDRLRTGDAEARNELLRHSQERLRLLIRRTLFRNSLHRLEETDDVLQQVYVKLDHMLGRLEVGTVREYFVLAAMHLRHVLIDLARYYSGRRSTQLATADFDQLRHGAAAATTKYEPVGEEGGEAHRLLIWESFHVYVAELPDTEREVFDMLWYHQLTQEETAALLKVNEKTVRRRWRSARILLMERFGGESPF